MIKEKVICAIDVGTSEIRLGIFTKDLNERYSKSYRRPSQNAAMEVNAELLWIDVLKLLEDSSGEFVRFELECIGITSHIGQICLDRDGKQVGIGGSWGDTRGAGEMKVISEEIPNFAQIVGRKHFTGGALPLLLWFKKNAYEQFCAISVVLSPKDFINFKLTGQFGTDPTTAAYSYTFDVKSLEYSHLIMEKSEISSECFPPVSSSTSVLGTLHPSLARSLGLTDNVKVIVGAPDGTVGISALIGDSKKVVACIAGSTDVYAQIIGIDDLVLPSEMTVNPYFGKQLWSVGGSTGLTGGAISFWDNLLSVQPGSQPSLCGDIPPGSAGLILTNYLSGSRFPSWNPTETGRLTGLQLRHTRAHFAKAIRESTAFASREVLLEMGFSLDNSRALFLAGGLIYDHVALQIRANVLNSEIHVCVLSNLSLVGTSILCAISVNWYRDIAEAQGELDLTYKVYIPNPVETLQYNSLYDMWLEARI